MVHTIDEYLALDRVRASVKQVPLITDVLFKDNKLIFKTTEDKEIIIKLQEISGQNL